MKRRSVVLLALVTLFVPPLVAHDASDPLTRAEVRLDLFGPADPAPASPLDQELSPMPADAAGKKSPALAALYSLLLPGMGELYAQDFSSGKYFLIAEGALWITYGAFTVHGNTQQDDARTYAQARAGLDPAGKDDQFYVDVGNFLTTEEYNEKQLRDREPDLLYDRAKGYGWSWDSDASRAAYKDERLASESTFNNRKFVVAAIIVNHVVSAINAARAAVAYNAALDGALRDLQLGTEILAGDAGPHGVMLTLRKGI